LAAAAEFVAAVAVFVAADSDAGKLHCIGLSEAHFHYIAVEKQTVVEAGVVPVVV